MPKQTEIRSQHSTDDERKEADMDYWITNCPGVSWGTLAGWLHYLGEKRSLQLVQRYLTKTTGMVIIIEQLFCI